VPQRAAKDRGFSPETHASNSSYIKPALPPRAAFAELLMSDFGKVLILLGAVLLVVGIVAVLLGRTNLPLGRLPGDFLYRGKNTTVYFPLATSLLVSVVLSLVLHVIGRLRK
jgi:hypothetical protein